ncbi:MAG: hypothetical protein ACYC5M_04540 [Anaerolineae bacterium]
MAEEDIVGILVMLLDRGAEWIDRRFGPQALAEAEDLMAVMEAYLERETAYSALWDDFLADPRALVVEMTGALETLAESEPSLSRVLNAHLQAWRQAAPRSQPTNAAGLDDVEPRGDEIPDVPTLESDMFEQPGGAYSYANLDRDLDSTDEDAEEDEEVIGLNIEELETVSEGEPNGVPQLFDRLMMAVEAETSIDRDARTKLEQLLQALRVEAFNAGRSEPEELAGHLRAVMHLSPQIGRMTIEGMRSLREDDLTLRAALALVGARERNPPV